MRFWSCSPQDAKLITVPFVQAVGSRLETHGANRHVNTKDLAGHPFKNWQVSITLCDSMLQEHGKFCWIQHQDARRVVGFVWRVLGVPPAGHASKLGADGVSNFDRCHSGPDRERLAVRHCEAYVFRYTDVASVTFVLMAAIRMISMPFLLDKSSRHGMIERTSGACTSAIQGLFRANNSMEIHNLARSLASTLCEFLLYIASRCCSIAFAFEVGTMNIFAITVLYHCLLGRTPAACWLALNMFFKSISIDSHGLFRMPICSNCFWSLPIDFGVCGRLVCSKEFSRCLH